MKLIATAFIVCCAGGSVFAQPAPTTVASPTVRAIIGLDNVKGNASGRLTVEEGALQFRAGKTETNVPVSSIDDIFIGAEVTQSGGKTGRVVKTAAIAAPFESGKALTILMRTKVDILTVAFHDPDGAVHGAIFALPKGQAEPLRMRLMQAGAHASASAPANQVRAGSKP